MTYQLSYFYKNDVFELDFVRMELNLRQDLPKIYSILSNKLYKVKNLITFQSKFQVFSCFLCNYCHHEYNLEKSK